VNAEQRLRELRAPDETGAKERAWAVVSSAYAARAPGRPRRARWRLAAVPVVCLLLIGLLLTPAGAAVRRLIRDALGVRNAKPALFSLPAPGRLLVSTRDGTWIVAADGAKRRLGAYSEATWSPRGLYVAVVGANELAAVDPLGNVRWTLPRPAVRSPSWFGPDGFRVAYLSGTSALRVATGQGSGDRQLAGDAASVAPAWRPGHPYQLAYVSAAGRVLVRDADSGAVIWSKPLPNGGRRLQWSSDGRRLLAVSRLSALVYDEAGRLMMRSPANAADVALSPDGRSLALVRGGDVLISPVTRAPGRPTRLFSLPGADLSAATWSPDGQWLLVALQAADQWIFVRATGSPRIIAVSHIAAQFASRSRTGGFPSVDGWCCSVGGTEG
jgi:hypothetical protein